ncbi:hypothetical protein Taro_030152, partial [Colocasia esculenta]|nr:hypothetical protein [Colocasia esculenta]
MAGEHAQMHELQQTVQGLTQALNNVIQASARNGAKDLYGNFQRINPPRLVEQRRYTHQWDSTRVMNDLESVSEVALVLWSLIVIALDFFFNVMMSLSPMYCLRISGCNSLSDFIMKSRVIPIISI